MRPTHGRPAQEHARALPAKHYDDDKCFMQETQSVFDIKVGLTANAKERRHAQRELLELLAPAAALWLAIVAFLVLAAPPKPIAAEGVVC